MTAQNKRSSSSQRELNILFTCVGRRVALMECFRDAMVRLDVRGQIIATDITPASPAFQLADVGRTVPRAGRLEYIPALLEIVKEHNVGLLVPLTDVDLRSLARQREKFKQFGCDVMVGSEESIALCRDKAQTSETLHKAGLPTIGTYSLNEFRKKPFFPCFVKPIRGSASVGTAVIRDDKELRAHAATFGELLIVQEYVPGQEFTIDVYRSRSGKVHCVVPRQRLVVRSGEVEKGITVKDSELIDSTVRLAGLFGDMWGVFCCQCRRGENGSPAKFFEINPRFGGGAPLSIAAGADLPLYLLQEVLDLPITAKLGEFTENFLMLRYDKAVFTVIDEPESLPGYTSPHFH